MSDESSSRVEQSRLFGGKNRASLNGREKLASRCGTGSSGGTVRKLQQLIDERRTFPTIYADPPWSYENKASRGAAENHYPTMSLDDICAEPVADLADENAHLHLWTTNGFLREAFEVIKAW